MRIEMHLARILIRELNPAQLIELREVGVDPSIARSFPIVIGISEAIGVVIGPLTNGATITGNSIHSNTGLGIDLLPFSGASGPTPNDLNDTDTNGGNSFQNFPIINESATTSSATTAQGTLNSTPNSDFAIEFFASPSCDPTGFGEGQLYLGQLAVSTDNTGNASFTAQLPTPSPDAWVITATATELLTGNTSEFSRCTPITSPSCPADLNADGELNFFDVSAFLVAFDAADPIADFTNDGSFNFFDVSAFLTAFGAGCP